jgi:hypothetical protein
VTLNVTRTVRLSRIYLRTGGVAQVVEFLSLCSTASKRERFALQFSGEPLSQA